MTQQPSFSIIVPVYNRQDTIGRAIQSCISQSYSNWELIIVNDGSTDETQKIVSEFMRFDRRIRMFVLPENMGRLAARNMGMKMARNEWVCWLDSDDEYMSNYLEVIVDEIARNQEYSIFNFGMLVKEREVINGVRFEKGYRIVPPLFLQEVGAGMESFPNGKIGAGSFVFKKELLKDVGYFPETQIPYGSEQSLPALLAKKDVIFEEICKKNDQGQWLPLGNPWGDDYSFFWYLTRTYKSKMIDVLLYIAHIRV